MAKNQRKKNHIAKLKATLNQKSESHGFAASDSTVRTAAVTPTINKSSANLKTQRLFKKPTTNSNGPTSTTNFHSQTKMKSTQSKHKVPKMASNDNVNVAPKAKPKEIPKNKPKTTSIDNNNQKNHIQPSNTDKKKKEKKKKPSSTVPVESKQKHENQPIREKNVDKGKRKFEESKADDNIHTKRMKSDRNGFIETDINSSVKVKTSNEKPSKKIKKKTLKTNKIDERKNSSKPKDNDGPSVKVINIDENELNGMNGQSDSEADSYIDKFFDDDKNDFDENRIYSMDEIKTENCNFLAKASGERTQSDDDTSSSEGIQIHNSDSQSDSDSDSDAYDVSGEIVSSKGKKKQPNNVLEKYMWSDSDSDGFNDDDDEEDEDDENGDMFYGSDSDVSLGSVVESDDLDDTYECETTDESMDDYEMNSSYEDYDDDEDNDSEFVDSDHSNYSYSSSESQSSQDTYDEFLNSKHYESSNDDQDFNDSRYDDVRIAPGTATTYKITDKRIKIFENDTESRIIEIPKTDYDDDHCVNLIPINVSRAKFMRIEEQKRVAEQAKLAEKKKRDERARIAHEKAVSDYYNMDNLSGGTSNHNTNDMAHRQPTIRIKNSVSIVKCPKNFKHFTMDWMQVEDDNDQQMPNDLDFPVYPKTKIKEIISIPNNNKLGKRLKKSKAQADNGELKQRGTNVQADEDTSAKKAAQVEGNVKTAKTTTASKYQTEPPSTQNKPVESKFFNSINSRHVLLLLRNQLHFHGSLHVKLIAGKVIAFGYELQHNKTVTLHSPRGHGFINLTASPSSSITNQRQYLRALDNLTADFYAQDIEYLKTQMNCAGDAILLLERDQTNKGVNMIDRYMRETMFPNINAFNNDSPFYSTEFVLRCKFFTEPENGLLHNEQWSTVKLNNGTKLVTIGGKGVGKSTFNRYVINSNIGKFPKFLFIDLDIGQPELFVPQTLSATVVTEPILGPGYLENIKPAKAVLFGDINVLPNPIKYLRCVMEIFAFCSSQNEFSTIPWVINTMGYSRGFGSELMACILKIFQPSDVVQIQSHTHADNFVQIMNADTVNTFKFNVFESEMGHTVAQCRHKMHVIDAICGKNNRKDMTAKDMRYTMILAKLGNCLKYDTDWLTSVKPFEASLDNLSVLITSDEEVHPSDYLDLLNGNLVYLCWRQPERTCDIIDCHGIGIVRSVDAQTRKLYLLSTISLAEMQHVNVLAIGAIPLPSAVFLNQHMQVRGAVPYVYNSDNFIGSKQVAQHIFRAESKSNNKPIQLMEH